MRLAMVDGVQILWIASVLLVYCLGWFGLVSISLITQFIIYDSTFGERIILRKTLT
jgi:hypothetical protein